MRIAVVIVTLAAIATALVHLRRREITVHHEIQRLKTQQVSLRRTIWDQQATLGDMTSIEKVQWRVDEITRRGQTGESLAERNENGRSIP